MNVHRVRELLENLHSAHNPLGSCVLADEFKFRTVRVELVQVHVLKKEKNSYNFLSKSLHYDFCERTNPRARWMDANSFSLMCSMSLDSMLWVPRYARISRSLLFLYQVSFDTCAYPGPSFDTVVGLF